MESTMLPAVSRVALVDRRYPVSNLNDVVQAELRRRKWREADLARAMGIERASLHKTLHSLTTKPSIDTLANISRTLQIPMEDLLVACGIDLAPIQKALSDIPPGVRDHPAVQEFLQELGKQPFDELLEWVAQFQAQMKLRRPK
jgi:transcriptional regulator with XRE-family HTH domain